MNYDALTVVYRQRQVDRLSRALQRLGEIETAPGRVVPEAEDLVIGAGRRLGVTIMFVDISGFSSWPAETLAEQKGVLAVLSLFFTEIVWIAKDYGGTVEKNTGADAAAQFDLGFMYRNGEGVPQDNGEALRWYRLAWFLSRCGHRIFPCPRSYSSAHFESFSLLRFNPAAGSSPRLRGKVKRSCLVMVLG